MATKGPAGRSASGASMSKYDVEVESRLQALEKAVKELQSHTHSGGGGGDIDPEQFKGLHEDVARMRKTLGI